MQQQQCRSRWAASFSIEDVDAVDIDDTVSQASHGSYSSVLVRGSLWIRKHSSFAGKARADRLTGCRFWSENRRPSRRAMCPIPGTWVRAQLPQMQHAPSRRSGPIPTGYRIHAHWKSS